VGDETGPNPTDRGKPGSKHHVLVDARGLPLAMQLGPANEHDSKRFEDLLHGVRPVRGRRGPPRKRPTKLHADKGCDYPRCVQVRGEVLQSRLTVSTSLASHAFHGRRGVNAAATAAGLDPSSSVVPRPA
jgi:Transposase DDE domain